MEDTEWNDILREKGIIPEKPKEAEIDEETIIAWVDKAVREKKFGKAVEDRNLEELDELEDLEDDDVLESYKRQRIAEMKALQSAEKYNSVLQISKSDYPREVTEASKECYVVVLLYQNALPACKLLNAILDRLAVKYKATKFCKIVADLCIENYPDKNVPTLLIYGEGDLKKQIVGMSTCGGQNATVRSVEDMLKMTGAIKTQTYGYKEDNDEEDELVDSFKINRVGKKDNYQSESDSD